MEINQNRDVHGRISRVLDALLEISEARVVVQNDIPEDSSRIDLLLSAIESTTSELHELIVEKRDKENSKDSGNTSLTEVCFDLREGEPKQAVRLKLQRLQRAQATVERNNCMHLHLIAITMSYKNAQKENYELHSNHILGF